ncbi:hypothetical protein GALMADRAFT_216835 [Galerina marginata CBS 339.88]|uniref:Uncharacterized protein n=1 Tax=Galerina marginata (strain CBS 339.88) TaxID=685588 RepID=A0A067SJ06_GALM3|nr:hypothetical protein GALMADRAFT_216835 [Galerina marginata CBS 339.88]
MLLSVRTSTFLAALASPHALDSRLTPAQPNCWHTRISSTSMLSALAPAVDIDRERVVSENEDNDSERETEKSKNPPAASFIKAYKLQEREREELERVVRTGEVLDDHVDLD